MTERFKILSLSGGGARGVFIAGALSELQRTTGKRIQDHFDMIAGTSTGGLIAIALAMGIDADQILAHYKNVLPSIFPESRSRSLWGMYRQWREFKYEPDELEAAVKSLVGSTKTLFDAQCRLCIPTVHFQYMRPTVLKTRHHAKYVRDPRLFAWEAAMATSAAPTYFPAFVCQDGRAFWDGGLWANDPSLVAVVEAHGQMGVPLSNIDILAIGTTKTVASPDPNLSSKGARHWLRMKNPKLLFDVGRISETASLEMSGLLVGQTNQVRIDDTLAGDGYLLDDCCSKTLNDLEHRGKVKVSDLPLQQRARFFATKAEPFVPIPFD